MQINHPINGDGDDIADIVYESSTWMLQYNSQSQTQKMCFEIQSKTYMIWYMLYIDELDQVEKCRT